MDAKKLVKMANEIGAFFASEPERRTATDGIAGHIRRFWDPRMRRELYRWLDEHGGAGVTPLVLEAVKSNREKLEPAPAPRAD